MNIFIIQRQINRFVVYNFSSLVCASGSCRCCIITLFLTTFFRKTETMGTPLKPLRLFLSPNVISPRSPPTQVTLPIFKINQKYCNNQPNQELSTADRHNGIMRRLDCSSSLLMKNDTTRTHLDFTNQIKIKVTSCDNYENKQSLVINTPNKAKLQLCGLDSKNNFKILGRGSFGTVVRGKYKDLDVAIKIVKLNKNTPRSILRESNALSLNHQNLVKIIDVLNQDKNYGIVLMEYIGLSNHLQKILDEKTVLLDEQKIILYALDICRGLLYCHENGVLHLDVKPSNILVCENGVCKLCDFGNSVKINNLNQPYIHQGTIAYTAPELLIGKMPTRKCDIYSLGILFWQMKYRKVPYDEFDSKEVVIYKVVKFGLRPTTEEKERNDRYENLFTDCWSSECSKRPNIPAIMNILSNLLHCC